LPKLGEARAKAQAAYEKLAGDSKAKEEDKKAAKEAWVKSYNDWKKTYDLYKALPEEADAWKVGGAVTAKYLEKL
jgi:hypothetical protein